MEEDRKHYYRMVNSSQEEEKLLIVKNLLDKYKYAVIIVNKENIWKLAYKIKCLMPAEFKVCVIDTHRVMKCEERNKVISDFRSSNIGALISTDIIVKGINFSPLPLVINFNPPQEYPYDNTKYDIQKYIDRSYLVGEYGRQGTIVTLIEKSEENWLNEIKDIINIECLSE